MSTDGKVVIGIEADSSEFEKDIGEAAESVDELGESARKAGKKTDETKSKFQELTETISKQEDELTGLRSAYTEAVINFGKGSAEAKDLKAQMQSLNDELSENKERLDNAKSAAEKFSGALNESGDSFGVAEVAAGNFVANALSGLISAVGNAVSSFIELSDSTREYRDDMAKLETAFTSAGHTTETATKTYEDFYAILGESDRSVEAVNHLAELTKNEEELAKWSEIAAGVTAKFGDSLPIEGLTEAANETAKVGEVTGPLADALNWAGISEDEFNEKLAACTSEQERATLITDTLNGLYSEAAAEYNELTKSTQDARRATSDMEQAQANMGATLEPLTTAWTSFKARAMEALVPVVQTVVGWLQKVQQWAEENPGKMEIIKGVVLALAVAMGVLAAALGISSLIKTVTTAFAALNAVMTMNPIGLIVAAIAGLVAGFIYLWNNCEGFRNFWINLWENVKEIAVSVATWLSETWTFIVEGAKSAWSSFSEFWVNLWNSITEWVSGAVNSIVGFFTVTIPGAIENVKQWFLGLVDTLVEFATVKVPEFIAQVVEWFLQLPERIAYAIGYVIGTIIQFGLDLWEFATVDVPAFIVEVVRWFSELPGKIWEWLLNTIAKVSEWVVTTKDKATEAASKFIENTIEFFSQLPGKVWGWLNNTITKISEWVVNAKNKAIEAGSNFLNETINFFKQIPGKVWEWLLNTIAKLTEFATNAKDKAVEAATGVYDSIVNGIKELPDKMMSIGKDIISGIWSGISSGWQWLKDKVSSLAESLFQGAKDALDINSPSKKFRFIGEMSVEGVGAGWEDEIGGIENKIKKDLSGLTARVQATVGAENAKAGRSMGTRDTGLYDLARAVGTQTAGINSLASQYRQGTGNSRPVILQLNGRELGRAVVNVGGAEETRVGTRLALGVT